eukprot:748414-Hanusia_phi.AAC.1
MPLPLSLRGKSAGGGKGSTGGGKSSTGGSSGGSGGGGGGLSPMVIGLMTVFFVLPCLFSIWRGRYRWWHWWNNRTEPQVPGHPIAQPEVSDIDMPPA